jgi:hypothetical protein
MIPLSSQALSTNYPVNFEGTASKQFSNSYLYTVNETATNFYVTTSNPKTGTKAFQWSTTARGKMLFKYTNVSTTSVCSNVSFWYDSDSGWTNGHTAYIGLFNRSLLGSTTVTNAFANPHKWLLFAMYQIGDVGGGKFYMADFTGSWIQKATTVFWNTATATKMSIYVNNSFGDMTYMWSGTHYGGTSCNVTALTGGYKIDGIMFMTSASVPAHMVIDDMNITISDSYGGTISGCSDFTGYTPTGSFGSGTAGVYSQHISTRFNVPVTTSIHGVELQISEFNYDEDSDVTHYTCSINGVSLGEAKCIFQESYYYVVQWEIVAGVNISNQVINFDFCHTQILDGGGGGTHQYWEVGTGVSASNDLNGDGEVGFYWQDTSVVYHWVWIGIFPFFVPTYGAGTTFWNLDLGMRFWATGFSSSEVFDFNNGLGLSHYSGTNATGYIYDLSLGFNNVMGSYTLGSASLSYVLNLYVNGTYTNRYGFPMICRYPGDGFGFSPDTKGKYRLQLNTTHAVANVTAWVVGQRPGYSIRTNPVISNQFLPYYVITDYHNPQGYSGGVGMDTEPSNLNAFQRCLYQRYPIANNLTSNFTYTSTSNLAEYWGLYTYVNALYSKVADCTHYIRMPTIYTNDIHTPRSNYKPSPEEVDHLNISLIGTHMFPGGDVRVYANSIYVLNVGDSQTFIEDFNPRHYGAFNITMYLYQNGTLTELAHCNFTVSTTLTPETEDAYGSMVDFIPTALYPYIAIGIIIGFMLAPFFLIFGLTKKETINIQIPPLAITMMCFTMAIIGFILDVLIGLLDWWTVGAFAFLEVLLFIIMWLQRKIA